MYVILLECWHFNKKDFVYKNICILLNPHYWEARRIFFFTVIKSHVPRQIKAFNSRNHRGCVEYTQFMPNFYLVHSRKLAMSLPSSDQWETCMYRIIWSDILCSLLLGQARGGWRYKFFPNEGMLKRGQHRVRLYEELQPYTELFKCLKSYTIMRRPLLNHFSKICIERNTCH